MNRIKRILKEPLLHFLLLGAAIFFLHDRINPAGRRESAEQIIVTRGQIAALAAGFGRAWNRPPTPEELTGLVEDYVREEVLCREALALGLDRDDTVIRRRLRQKMEFIADDFVEPAPATGAELEAHLKAYPDRFKVAQRLTFSHVYLSPARRGTNLATDATRLQERLNRDGTNVDPASVSDPFLLDYRWVAVSPGDLEAQFGRGFAVELAQLPAGRWSPPVTSGYGWHLVRIEERIPGRLPALPEIREAVERDWVESRRRAAAEQRFQAMRRRYTITVEDPAPGGGR